MLNPETLRKKTINQITRMVIGRIRKCKTADTASRSKILDELRIILETDKIIEREWYEAVKQAGGTVQDWDFASHGGIKTKPVTPSKAVTPAQPVTPSKPVTRAKAVAPAPPKPVTPSKPVAAKPVTPSKPVAAKPVTPSKRGGFRANAGKASREQAAKHAEAMQGIICQMLSEKYSLQEIANHLNHSGFSTQQGKLLTRTHVHRIIKRLEG